MARCLTKACLLVLLLCNILFVRALDYGASYNNETGTKEISAVALSNSLAGGLCSYPTSVSSLSVYGSSISK